MRTFTHMSDYTPLTFERIHNVLVDNQFILCSSLEMTYMHEKSAKYISFRIEHGSCTDESSTDEDTTEDAEEGAGEEGMARGAGPELRGVQDCAGTQAGERTDAKFGAKFGAGTSFSDRACFFAARR